MHPSHTSHWLQANTSFARNLLATSVSEAQALADAAARSGLICVVPFVYRFYASVRDSRTHPARRRGPVAPAPRLLPAGLAVTTRRHHWRIDPAQGGASAPSPTSASTGCDLVEFTTGHRISSLSANLLRIPRAGVAPGSGTEDAATIIFVTDQGAAGSLTVSQVSPGRKNRLWFSLDGSQASYEFNQELPDSLWIGGREENILLPGPLRLRSVHRGTTQCPPVTPRDTRIPSQR